jgi:arylsulfatase A-like enzyme
VDDLCVIRSMRTDLPNHEPSLLMMNCGDLRQVRPSFGSWLTYGLGTENQNLPGFIVLCPYGYPVSGTQNWTAGFLPSVYQGAYIDTKETEVERLIQHIKNNSTSREQQRKQLDLLAALNQRYQKKRQEDSLVEAQIQSYELAFRMQAEATDAFDVSKEPEPVRKMYGETVYGRQTLIARRLLERGVRFVQIWQGKDQPWDNHEYLASSHKQLAQATDKPIAALLADLKQRGMLDDTLVIWGGEFGRTPVVELTGASGGTDRADWGRDHNNHGFTMWLAGGGVKKGYVYGATDEFGFAAAENPVHVHDLHATLLHLLGFDHERLTYRYAGRDFRLTDVQGLVVKDLLK